MQASAAIKMGTQGPPSLHEFWLRKELHSQLGMTLEEFQALPWRTAEEYITYLQLITREENEQRRRQNARR